MTPIVYLILILVWTACLVGNAIMQIMAVRRQQADELAAMEQMRSGQTFMNVKTKNLDMDNEFDGMTTQEMAEAILRKLNCQVEKEDDGTMSFVYQGATFNLFSESDSPFMTIAFLWWESVSLDNLENVSCMQKAVNSTNATVGRVTTFYVIDNDSNRMLIGSKYGAILVPQVPMPMKYMEALLADLFQSSRIVESRYIDECKKAGIERQ